MVVNMHTISVCVLVLFVTNDVQGRYIFESTIRGSIETNKIISSFEDAASQCKTEGAVLAAPVNKQLRDEMMAFISVNNHSTPYFINAKLVHTHKPQFVSSEGVSLDDMSVSDMIEELDPRDGECLAMDSRTIRVVSCSAPLPYMCYKENDITTPVPVARTAITEPVNLQTSTLSPRVVTDCGTTDTGYKFVESTGSCYKHHPEEKNWDDASSVCTAEGGYLVIINDKNEARVIRNKFFPIYAYATYIGLRDYNDNDIWTSVHGDDLNSLFNEWHDDHSTQTDMNCGILDLNARLNDYRCTVECSFVCEKNPRARDISEPVPVPARPVILDSVGTSIVTDAPTTETVVQSTTEQDIVDCDTTDTGYKFVESTGSCYKHHPEEKNWDDASSVCTAEGGYLVILNDENEARVIRNKFFPYNGYATYIGLRDYNDNDIWTSVHGDDLNSLFNEWHDGHSRQTDMNCGTLDTHGRLNDYRCTVEWSFVCEKNPRARDISVPVSVPARPDNGAAGGTSIITDAPTTETVVQTTTEQDTVDCDTTDTGYKFVESTGSCYKHHPEEKNWDDASSVCTAEGGYLVILNDENEARIIRNKFFSNNGFATYIGLRDYNDNDIWTSVHGDDLNSLFNEWHDGHSRQNDMNCGALDKRGRLNDYRCTVEWSFVCEKNPPARDILVPVPALVAPAGTEGTSCGTYDEGYKLNIATGSCYKFHGEHKTWFEANSTCLSEGGYLAVINNGDEAQAIHDRNYNTQGFGVFIGLHKPNNEIGWISITGIPFAELYNVWHVGHRPSVHLNCGMLDDAGKIDDQFCVNSRPFLCEKDPKSSVNASSSNAISSSM
ncbi:C-type mannose receptor 2-like [Anticarsia gemmatalis]|uniref:C-type mannose receptor 2-like n=1 Tax=Anticarsia gemmatalis TaxID=129554 RepID=UPI003F76BC07